MEYKLGFQNPPKSGEYLEQKSLQLGNDVFAYWVTKKQDDPSYEEINSEFGSGLSAILNLSKDNDNLKQALMSSQKALFTANNQMESMKQMIMKLQKQLFNQQQNTGGTKDVSK